MIFVCYVKHSSCVVVRSVSVSQVIMSVEPSVTNGTTMTLGVAMNHEIPG